MGAMEKVLFGAGSVVLEFELIIKVINSWVLCCFFLF